jgi:hypothetical protein
MSDPNTVDISFNGNEVEYNQDFMDAMWVESGLIPYAVEHAYSFDAKGERVGIVDLLCPLENLTPELRDKGPEAIIEAVLELLASVYIGNDEVVFVGKVLDLYAVEVNNRAGIVFRTIVLDGGKQIEEIMEIREIGMTLFPVPHPE